MGEIPREPDGSLSDICLYLVYIFIFVAYYLGFIDILFFFFLFLESLKVLENKTKVENKNNTRQYKAIQGNTRQYKAIQGNTKQYKAIQGNSRQFKAIQGNSRQFKAIQGNSRQFKAIQDG